MKKDKTLNPSDICFFCSWAVMESLNLDQKAWIFGFLIEHNDAFHFLSIQSSLSVKKDV